MFLKHTIVFIPDINTALRIRFSINLLLNNWVWRRYIFKPYYAPLCGRCIGCCPMCNVIYLFHYEDRTQSAV